MLFYYTIFIAIAAFTYSEILTSPGMLLNQLYDWLELRLPEWLFKPLIGCCKCVAGQWALFMYLYLSHSYYLDIHVWFILQTIFNAAVIRALYYKITN
jgi:hypothetical protein